jgi:hypothetical protein
MCPIGLDIGWLFDGTGTGLWFGAEYGVSATWGFGALEATPYVRVNLCALAACIYLLLWPMSSKGLRGGENATPSEGAGQHAVAALVGSASRKNRD